MKKILLLFICFIISIPFLSKTRKITIDYESSKEKIEPTSKNREDWNLEDQGLIIKCTNCNVFGGFQNQIGFRFYKNSTGTITSNFPIKKLTLNVNAKYSKGDHYYKFFNEKKKHIDEWTEYISWNAKDNKKYTQVSFFFEDRTEITSMVIEIEEPELHSGYYSIQDIKSNKYWGAKTLEPSLFSNPDLNTIFKLEKKDNGLYNISVQGKYVSNKGLNNSLTDSPQEIELTPQEIGYKLAYSEVILTEIHNISVPNLHLCNGKYYRTLFLPFPIQKGEGNYEMFIPKEKIGNRFNCIPSKDNIIDAGCGVIIESQDKDITLRIPSSSSSPTISSSLFIGTYLQSSYTHNMHILGVSNNVLGMYKWNQNTLNNNIAYYLNNSSSTSFSIDMTTSGIKGITTDKKLKNIRYNLFGHKIKSDIKGFCIENGKIKIAE